MTAKTARATPARFTGFADREARFFRALAKHQTRAWFAEHRAEYEDGWLAPMQALLAEVRARLVPAYGREEIAAPKVFRIHRDVRFSKDKSPYKTHIGGYLGIDGTGSGPSGAAALYLHVASDETFVAAGQYMMDGKPLARFREAVADEREGATLAAILRPLEKAGFTVGSHAELQRVPRGFDPDHPRAALLRRKGLMVVFPPLPRTLLTSPKLVGWLVTHAKRTAPLVEWLAGVVA